jgi:hypothetical protein
MMKPLLLVPAALLGLASASPPPASYQGAGMDAGYPPCSAKVTDRCVQAYERHRLRHRGGDVPAPPAPAEVAGDDGYPPCTASRTDRCTQLERRAAPTRYARWERERVRIGERG